MEIAIVDLRVALIIAPMKRDARNRDRIAESRRRPSGPPDVLTAPSREGTLDVEQDPLAVVERNQRMRHGAPGRIERGQLGDERRVKQRLDRLQGSFGIRGVIVRARSVVEDDWNAAGRAERESVDADRLVARETDVREPTQKCLPRPNAT